uniref:Uncharacterized protein n=1 Tax=Neolamprologus brichardi TaxID=32507 RepID=A0A3Q4H019_NEOBR
FLCQCLKCWKRTSVYWIVKPVDLSRGRGIFIFEDIKDLVYDCSVVIQRYISSSLLISGYKFDLRIYVCVKSFHPLTVYIHQEGLVRFATEKFNLSSLHNLYAHLTNTSINKFGPFYKTEKGRRGFAMNSAALTHLIWFCTKLVKMWTSTEIIKALKVLQSCQMDRYIALKLSGTVVSTIASQQEGPGFDSTIGLGHIIPFTVIPV